MNELLKKIFKEDIKEPFFYTITLDTSNLFESIKEIFFLGFKIHYGEDTLKIDHSAKNKIKMISQYMLSMGIKVNFKEYDLISKEHAIKKYLYNIEKIEGLAIKVQTDWHTSYIENITLNNNNNKESFNKLVVTTYKDHKEIIHLMQILKPIDLEDYCIKVMVNNIIYIISFSLPIPDYLPNKIIPKYI